MLADEVIEAEPTNEKPDKIFQPYPDKDCKTCMGKGYFFWTKDPKAEAILRPCGCIKLIEVDAKEN